MTEQAKVLIKQCEQSIIDDRLSIPSDQGNKSYALWASENMARQREIAYRRSQTAKEIYNILQEDGDLI